MITFKQIQDNIQKEWKQFCRGLYSNLLAIEKDAEKQYMKDFKSDMSFQERIWKIKKCQEYKNLIKEFADKKIEITNKLVDVISTRGFDYYFRNYTNVPMFDL